MSIIRPRVWTQQPQIPVEIDWSNPLTEGLEVAGLPPSFVDVAADMLSSTITGTKIQYQYGEVVSGFGATSGVGASDVVVSGNRKIQNNATTVLVHLNTKGLGGGSLGRVFQKDTGVIGAHTLYVVANTNNYRYVKHANGVVVCNCDWNGAGGGVHHQQIIIQDGTVSNPAVYINGISTPIIGTGLSANPAPPLGEPWHIGNRADGTRNYDGEIGLFCVWNRAISGKEAYDLSVNPWQIFRPRVT